MKQLKTVITFLLLFIVSASFSQGLNCNTATPYCDAPGGASVTFPNNTNNSSESGPNYGCLTTHPNPAWFYFKTTTAGNYIFDLGQGTTCGGTNLDVDFICWGPFTNPTTACNNLTAGNTVDCSYSPSATEVIDVVGAPAGQYYIVLITNYSNSAGCVSFGLQGSSPPTDCSITCASVLSGPGIVSFPSTSPLNGVAATPMPASVACNSGIQNMYATNVTPFGNPITPGVMVSFLNNANTSNSVSWYENSALVGCFGPSASCQNLTTSYSEQLQFSYMSPSATNQFSFCENNTAQPNITNTNVKDLSGGANMPGAPFTWNDDGACQTITIPPGTVRGISTWGSTCGACLTGVTDWGAAQFNPAAASIGTHTITYTFDSQQPGCTPYTTSITITVTNPYNAAFTTPGPFCAGAACVTLNPSNTYTVGTGTFAGTGISGNSFCPATAGVGTFPITYTVGVSPTCRASQTNNIVVNANPTANAGSPAALTCLSTNTTLTGSGGGTYSWTGPAGGISAGANSATPTVSLAGTYTLLVANGTCTNSATVSVSQNTATPTVAASVSNTLTCTNTSINANATTTMTPVSYNWSGPGITGGAGTGTISANQAGTYNYTVTNTSSGCRTIGSLSVSQNTATPVVAAASSSLNCVVTSVNASATTATSPVSYNWNGPGITAGAGTGTITLNQPGTYNYTVTNTSNGCSTIGSQAITQNTTVPTVNVSGTQTITCASPSVSLIGSANPSTCTPVWTGGVCAGATSYTASACSPNTYTLTITNPLNGCTASGTVNAVASVGVPSVTASNSGSITCTNTTAQITASTTMTPVSYAWTGPGSITGASSSTGTVSVGGSYQCIVTNTLTGCASTITTIVPTNTTPVSASIAPTSSITCTTTSLTLSASPTGAFSYSWAPAAGLTGNSVATPTVNQGGTYSVTITNTVNGCFANANVTVPANTVAPTANIAVNSITTTCSAPTATLNVTATPTTGATYSWTAPGSGSLNTYTVSNPVASGSGVFTVVVTNTINGCSNAASQATVQIIPDAAIPTVSVSASNLTITCTNTTVTTSLTSTNTITSYNWSPAPVTGGANPVFNTPGTYNATVTASNGCAANVSINVALNNTVPTLTLNTSANNGTLTCLTTSISITPTVSPSSNLTFTWSPSAGISTSTNQSSATFTAAGIYTLAVTNTVNGCVTSSTNTANAFTVIADNTPPTFTLGTAPSVTTTCAAPNATLSASSNADPNAVYTWTTPTSSTLTGNPINTAAAGIYTVAVTNTVNGCNSSAVSTNTIEVVVDAGIPSITLSASSLSITCTNPTPSVAISTTATPVTYSWSPTSGIVPGTETTANPSFNAAGSYSVVVTNTNSGCATDITTNVVNVTLDNTVPVISLSSSVNDGTITCTSTSVVVNPTVTPSSNLTYTWSPSAGISSPINQSSATFTAAGVYTLAVTNTLTGCVSTSTSSASTFTVFLNNATPTITTTQTSTNSVIGCTNPIVSYSTNVTSTGSSLTYTWNPGGVNTPTIDINTAGVYDVTVMDAVSGCTASTQFTLNGNTTIPSADAGTSTNIACGSSSVALNGTSTATNVSYTWTGPNASSIISGSNTANPAVSDTGSYVLTVIDNLTGCQNTSTVVVTQANVAASFTANPTTGISPLTVNFTDQSTGANTWNWSFGDSNSSNSQNPTNTFNSGTYTVTLTASTGSCVSTATLLIIVEDGLTLEIPNVFTPNGDNVNDIFTVKSSGVKEITLQIFNRWGEKLYEFAGSKASWDGKTPNSGNAPEGTYFFFVKATGFDDKSIEQHGTLNLFR